MAEKVGFEPTEHCCSTVFKTASLNRSDTPPESTFNYKGGFMTCQPGIAMPMYTLARDGHLRIGSIGPSTQENSTKVSNVPFILLLMFSS